MGMVQKSKAEQPIRVEDIAWRAGQKIVDFSRICDVPDVQMKLEWLDGGKRPGHCAMVTQLVPVVRVFLDLGPFPPEVHTFRYIRADGHPAMLLWCCDCGHLVHCAQEELSEFAASLCPKCSSIRSGKRCKRWHAWGTCQECEPIDFGKSPDAPSRGSLPGPGRMVAASAALEEETRATVGPA